MIIGRTMKIPSSYGPQGPSRAADAIIGLQAVNKAESGSDITGRRPEIGIDSVTITGIKTVHKRAVYSMSDLKGKADSALLAQNTLKEKRADKPEPLIDSQIGATRQELVELTRLRISAGFYNRPDVIDAIAKRIIDSF